MTTRQDKRGMDGPGEGDSSLSSTAIRGAVGGVCAFVAGYLVYALLFGSDLRRGFVRGFSQRAGGRQALEAMGVTLPSEWVVSGWGYYATHYVNVEVVARANGAQRSATLPDLTAGFGVWNLIPPLVLLIAGALVARSVTPVDGSGAATAGATVVAGYLPAAVAGKFLFTWETTLTIAGQPVGFEMAPALVGSVLVAGTIYPLLFGALGGFAAYRFGGGASTDEAPESSGGRPGPGTGGREARRTAPEDRSPAPSAGVERPGRHEGERSVDRAERRARPDDADASPGDRPDDRGRERGELGESGDRPDDPDRHRGEVDQSDDRSATDPGNSPRTDAGGDATAARRLGLTAVQWVAVAIVAVALAALNPPSKTQSGAAGRGEAAGQIMAPVLIAFLLVWGGVYLNRRFRG